ncbi:MAG: DUF3488 domain-containing transglutaminase family protein [Aquificae bacterium]|nr:DUF3488 domain-containing transglutaminase family protein [Aquificota bacterium]
MARGKVGYRAALLTLLLVQSLLAFLGLLKVTGDPFLLLPLLITFSGYLLSLKGHAIRELLLFPVAAFGAAFFLLQLSLEELLTPLARALTFILSVKWLGKKETRDALQILTLSSLGVALTVAADPSPSSFLLLASAAFNAFLFLVLLTFYAKLGDAPLEKSLVKSLLGVTLVLFTATLTASWLFFFLLPRPEGPLFNPFKKKGGLVSGLTDGVELGEVGKVRYDETVVLRVFGPVESPYWRVLTLELFDGKKWSPAPKDREPELPYEGLRYRLIVEPTLLDYLPTPDYPFKIEKLEGARLYYFRLTGGIYRVYPLPSAPVKITVTASPFYAPRDPPTSVHYQLPDGLSPRVVELAKELGRGARNARELIKRVKAFFKDFSYTDELPPAGDDPLEAFLFKHRKGNCEYFASATAVILRLNGVPARLVAGFHGAVKNEFGNYYLVLHSMAHVWVEAYDGEKWLRVDTTPPYAPPALNRVSKLELLLDALLTFWYDNVVGFSAKKQRKLFVGFKDFLSRLKAYGPQALGLAVLLILTALAFRLYFTHFRETPENLLKRLKAAAEKKGVKASTPEEILKAFRGKPEYERVKFVVRAYQRYKYSPYRDKKELKEAFKVVKTIK